MFLQTSKLFLSMFLKNDFTTDVFWSCMKTERGRTQRSWARGSRVDGETDRSTDIPLWSPVQSGVAAGTAPVSDGVYTRTVQRHSLSRQAGLRVWNTLEELYYPHTESYHKTTWPLYRQRLFKWSPFHSGLVLHFIWVEFVTLWLSCLLLDTT